MAPRAYWKGYLKLSLVSCPIALYPASSSSERVSFHRINKKTGNRLKQQQVDSETGDLVEKDDIGRGYEVGKGEYLQVSDEELEKIEIESTHTIEIDSFVPRGEIDDRYLNAPYYITPTDKVGQEAFVVIRDAIKEKNVYGVGYVADQLDLAPKNILTSVMENMSVAIFRMAKSVDAGKFEGKNNVIGLEAPQVARLGTYNSIVPQDIRRQVEDVKKLLISKTIVQK